MACARLRSAIADEAVVRLNFTADLQEMLDILEVSQPVQEQIEMQQFREIVFMATRRRHEVRKAIYEVTNMIDYLEDDAATVCTVTHRLLGVNYSRDL
jgi:hypothetical protein